MSLVGLEVIMEVSDDKLDNSLRGNIHIQQQSAPPTADINYMQYVNNSNQNGNTTIDSDDSSTRRQSNFTIIWHNLTYTVDTGRWYHRFKERLLGRDFKTDEPTQCMDNGQISGQPIYGKRKILNRVSGSIKSGQLTAILGPSGAGKSSLLHCLFQNRSLGTTGQILVDSPKRHKLRVCFIPQHDYLNEWLTVREDLIFVSKLKLARINGTLSEDSRESLCPNSRDDQQTNSVSETYVKQVGDDSHTSLIDHGANALYVAELLGLVNCLDVQIKNISGGQKKRLSIARELMSKPDILVLDEPTTGLDSLTCYKTIMVLKDLVRLSPNPMAVVVTIHQPQRAVFNLFDKTYLLSKNGRVMYDGDPKTVVHKMDIRADLKLPTASYNPATFLIEIASDNSRLSAVDRLSHHQLVEFYSEFDTTRLRDLMKSTNGLTSRGWKFCTADGASTTLSNSSIVIPIQMSKNSTLPGTEIKTAERTTPSGEDEDSISEQYHISYHLKNCLSSHPNTLIQSFRHVFILTHRSWLSVIRNPTFTRTRLIFHTFLPLLMLVVFGSQMGRLSGCPKLEVGLGIEDLMNDVKNGVVERNIDETRFCMENVSFFFIMLYGFGMNIISCTASFYPLTMHMFKKEMINGLYTSGPYFIGQMLAELPLEIFFPSISVLLSYPLSGQISSYLEWRMITVAFAVFLVSYCIHSLGLFSGSVFPNNISVAVLMGQLCLLPFVLFSGFMRPPKMPLWMMRCSYISPFKHGLTAIMAARYGFGTCDCDEDLLPNNDGTGRLAGLRPGVRKTLDYLYPKGNSSDSVSVTEIFDQLGKRFAQASNNGIDVRNCDDVKPFVMHVFEIDDSDLFYSIGYLILFIACFKLVTYSIMKSFPYR